MDTSTTHWAAEGLPAPQHHTDELSALAEAVPALVFVTDADGWILQVNRRFQQYTGLGTDGLASGTWLSFVHAHDRSRALAAWNAARDERRAVELQVRLAPAGGPCEAFDCRAVPVVLDGGIDRWAFTGVASQFGQPAQAALKHSDAWFQHAFEHAAVGLARVAPDGRLLAVNERLCRMLGYSRSQLLGSDIRRLAPAPGISADGSDAAAPPQGACDQHPLEQHWLRADGSVIEVALHMERVPDKDSVPEHFVCVVEQRCEPQAAEVGLVEHEAVPAGFVESAPVALALFDRDMRYLAHSGSYPGEIGMPPGQLLVGRSHYEVLPELPQRWREIHARVLQGEEHRGEAEPFHRPDGSTDWVRWAMRPWRRRSSAINGAVLFFEVVTAQVLSVRAQQDTRQRLRHSEAEARRTAERLAQILDSLPHPVWARDLDGLWTLVNPAAAQLLGRPRQLAPGRRVRDARTAAGAVEGEDARVLHEGATVHAEIGRFDVQRGQARTWLSTRLPLRSSDGHITELLGVAHDITEQRHARHDGRGGDKDIEGGRQAEMVTEAGNTAGAALQEVEYRVCDNLQLGISLLALQARSERDAAAQRALTQAQARVAVVARLHEQMVASGSRAGLDYAACARELAADALAAVRSRQGAALDFCCPGALLLRPEVTVPLSLVLWELLDNAVRHAFADGSASTLTLRIAREEGQLRLLVADDGVGLAPGLDPAPAQAVQASRWLRRCCSSSAARSRFSTRGAALHAWWPCHCRRMRRQLPAHKVCNATMQQHCHNSMRQSMDWTGERSR